ncbi:MAG: GntR family transcriptional regulator [Proteobacteria bacterium]|nr:GntR family transcriptional regulator [Pseudomonadota bacterium]MBU4470154.1 GntR family transcriptional regulator [Pseudomonadota bacterium]MCG2753137.1 GntR family transcriptional regulator [Desulfobacteraceae bacterium]
MLLHIDHHSGVPIYRQIMDQIREQIMTGLLKEGEQLMTVRELAGELNVNPMTVSKAYSAMETEGVLKRRRGIGLFVAEMKTQKKLETMETVLQPLLSRVVTTAIQIGVSKKKTQQMLDDLFEKYKSEKRGGSDESC